MVKRNCWSCKWLKVKGNEEVGIRYICSNRNVEDPLKYWYPTWMKDVKNNECPCWELSVKSEKSRPKKREKKIPFCKSFQN